MEMRQQGGGQTLMCVRTRGIARNIKGYIDMFEGARVKGSSITKGERRLSAILPYDGGLGDSWRWRRVKGRPPKHTYLIVCEAVRLRGYGHSGRWRRLITRRK